MRQEILTHTFNLSRRSFAHNPNDPPIRKKKELQYDKKWKVFYNEPVQGSCP